MPHHTTPGTKENHYMLTLNFRGKGFYRNSLGMIEVKPGMAGIVPPSDRGILISDVSDPYDHFYCRFRGEFAGQLCNTIIAEKKQRFFAVPHMEKLLGISQQIPNLGSSYDRTFSRADAKLLEILAFLKESAAANPHNELPFLAALQDYISNTISLPFSLQRCAAEFGMSPGAFCRKVKQQSEQTPLQIVTLQKVEWAKQLLAYGGLSVSQTALRVGFNDPFYFSKVFKQITGSSPSVVRKRREV